MDILTPVDNQVAGYNVLLSSDLVRCGSSRPDINYQGLYICKVDQNSEQHSVIT